MTSNRSSVRTAIFLKHALCRVQRNTALDSSDHSAITDADWETALFVRWSHTPELTFQEPFYLLLDLRFS
jgi:hypothetical protein